MSMLHPPMSMRQTKGAYMTNDTKSKVAVNSGYDAAYWEEKVDWTVPFDMQNPASKDYTVWVNGKCFHMKRGETVQVPRYVIQVYKEQQAQLISEFKTQTKFQNAQLADFA